MKDEDILDNIMAIFSQIIAHLPNEKNNLRHAHLKLTMGKSFKVGAEEAPAEEKKEPVAEEKVEAPAKKKKEEAKD